MGNRTIGIFLKMKDGYSASLNHFRNKARTTEADVAAMAIKIDRLGKKVSSTFKDSAKKGAIALGGLTSVAGGFALKTGFSEAFNMEGYKAQLETATKDTKKAGEIMKYSIELANKTPFEGGELVEAAAKFESMGMSAKKWLTLTGDMAGATNKSFDQATEALIDAQTGELERLKEFGLKKADIAKKAAEMFKGQEIMNSKGQITDLKKFNEAMIAVMEERYAGGMEKLSKTIKGRWSTVTGVTKSALSSLAGMGTDGVVRQGSALDLLSKKLDSISDKFTQWQSDGTIDRMAIKVDAFAKKAFEGMDKIGNGLIWVKDNANTLIPIVKTLGGLLAFSYASKKVYGLYKGLKQVGTVFKALRLKGNAKLVSKIEVLEKPLIGLGDKTDAVTPKPKKGKGLIKAGKSLSKGFGSAMLSIGKKTTKGTGKALSGLGKLAKGSMRFGRMFRGASALFRMSNPFGWLTIAIESGIILYQNWDKIKTLFGKLYNKYQDLKGHLKTLPLPNWVKKGASFLFNLLTPLGLIKSTILLIKNYISSFKMPDWMVQLGTKTGEFFGVEVKKPKTSKETTKSIPKLPKYATGTSYFKGGLAITDEGGRGEIKVLPNGTEIIPHSLSKKRQGGQSISISITIEGNVIGEDKYIDHIGKRIAQEVKMAIIN